MKKILLIGAALWLLSGCDSKETAEQETTAPAGEIKITENAVEVKKEDAFAGYTIDGERTVRFAPDGEETPLTRQIGALATIKNNYERLNAELLKKRLSKNFILKCSACHDDYANGVIGPSLLTKSEEEIFSAIAAYKNRTKVNVLMKELVTKMPESEIRALAKEIAEFNKEIRSQNVQK